MLKRLLLSAALATACSSGGATPNDAGTPDAGGASQGACAALCAASSCGASCEATCSAGGAAVPQCQARYEAVVRCAERSGQHCMFAQGGGPSCATEGQAYAACVSGDTDAGSGATDAGSGGTDAGSEATDAGSGGTDAGTVTGESVVGRWTFATTAPRFDYELNFTGEPGSGSLTYQSVNTLETSGCVTTNEYSGRWTRTGNALSVTFTSGTTAVTMCNDSSRNAIETALPDENLGSTSMGFTGPITVSESELTFTMFRGTSSRSFTRSR